MGKNQQLFSEVLRLLYEGNGDGRGLGGLLRLRGFLPLAQPFRKAGFEAAADILGKISQPFSPPERPEDNFCRESRSR